MEVRHAGRAPRPFLAVEDDPAIQRAISQAVAGRYAVRFASSGTAGLQTLAEGELPLFVLLDFMLPDQDGLEVVRALRANARTRRIPVVIFSSVRDARVQAALDAGANSWVRKPDDPRAFSECVQRVCEYWMHVHVSS
ncbi:MAG TPA: response regulator [Candidatus Thermoplasmatota archaeon]|nr:response regulator [Candidatus Thermoplasmatota archaeon]